MTDEIRKNPVRTARAVRVRLFSFLTVMSVMCHGLERRTFIFSEESKKINYRL